MYDHGKECRKYSVSLIYTSSVPDKCKYYSQASGCSLLFSFYFYNDNVCKTSPSDWLGNPDSVNPNFDFAESQKKPEAAN